ncbi:hypothetical protein PIB30_068191 [Stylosanthes scabra]|uniref:Uncharacterized protein n=1 Tax=Stylosanthes scabra TaxID=79078 RepID=A0ABU6VL85_9FABA|nr:hypothetical protein [Stylosanthes scabra]
MEDEQTNPEFQVQIQQNSDPEFQEQESETQIQQNSNSEMKNQTPEFESDEGDVAEITDPENSSEINEDKLEIQYSDSTILECETAATQIPEFKKSTKLKLNSKSYTRSQFQRQYKEDEHTLEEMHKLAGDVTGSFTAGSVGEWSVLARVAVTHEPPPELPDLYSNAVKDGATTTEMVIALAMSCTPENLKKVKIGVRSGVEDGVVVKGKVKDNGAYAVEVGDEARTSAEVGASAKENDRRRAEYSEAQNHNGRTTQPRSNVAEGAHGFGCPCLIVAKPQPLMAAVFPWDREEATRTVVSDAPETTEVTMDVAEERAVANLVRARAGVAQRPPSNPPHLIPVTVVLGEAAAAVANSGFTGASPEVAGVM